MKDNDEGVAEHGDDASVETPAQWVPRPLFLEPPKSARIIGNMAAEGETHGDADDPEAWIRPGYKAAETLSFAAVDSVTGDDSAEDDDSVTADEADGSTDADDGHGAAPSDASEPGSPEGRHHVIEGTVVPADTTEVLSLRPEDNRQENRRKAALWLRIGAVATALIVVGTATYLGFQAASSPNGQALDRTVAPTSGVAEPGTGGGAVDPPNEPAPIDEGVAGEAGAEEEPSAEIPKGLATNAPSGGDAANTSTDDVVAPDSPQQPGNGAVPAPPAPPPVSTPKPTVVTAGQVVLSQYSDRNGTLFWLCTVNNVSFGAQVRITTSDGRVNHNSRPPLGLVTVRTGVPAGQGKIVWTVTVDGRNGYAETLVTE